MSVLSSPTFKSVIYKTIKKHDEALAAYYNEYQEHPDGKGYKMKEVYEKEFDFWYNELKILPIPENEFILAIEKLNNAVSSLDYISEFEANILPYLLRYWSFN